METEKSSLDNWIYNTGDDASGLEISEKMRYRNREQNTGMRGMEDGVSWAQTGKGAVEEVETILQRMKELASQAANSILTGADRALIQQELLFQRGEIDRILKTARLNGKHIFSEYSPASYRCVGSVKWASGQQHIITLENHTLELCYRMKKTDKPETYTLTVPTGFYTTGELLEKAEDILYEDGMADKGLRLEYTQDNTVDVVFENAAAIEALKGGLTYLLFDVFSGGGVGAILGTLEFASPEERFLVSEKNYEIGFFLEDFTGHLVARKLLKLPYGSYTRQQLMTLLNQQLAGTTVKAVPYGRGIMLYSEEHIITGLSGNMFRIPEEAGVRSVFYRHFQYGKIHGLRASFTGGAVLTSAGDMEHHKYRITQGNNRLVFHPNGKPMAETIWIPEGSYTADEMAAKLNKIFQEKAMELTAASYTRDGYEGLVLTSNLISTSSSIGLDISSSAYDTLFVKRVYNAYQSDVTITREDKPDKSAVFTGSKILGKGFSITRNQGNVFVLSLNQVPAGVIQVPEGVYANARALANKLNELFGADNAPAEYKGKVIAGTDKDKLTLSSVCGTGVYQIMASSFGDNQGYCNIFEGKQVTYIRQTVRQTGSAYATPAIRLNTPVGESMVFDESSKNLVITLNEKDYTVSFPVGIPLKREEIIKRIEDAFVEAIEYNTFRDLFRSGDGVEGSSEATPAVGTAGCDIQSTIRIQADCDTFRFVVNNEAREVHLEHGIYQSRSDFAYMMNEKLSPWGLNVTLNENQLKYTTRDVGDDASFMVTYDDGGTAMRAIYGDTVYSNVSASFEQGRLRLVSMQNNGSIQVNSDTGSIFQTPDRVETPVPATVVSGYSSTVHAGITGAALKEPVAIHQWNKIFAFTYRKRERDWPVRIEIPEGRYRLENLVRILQERLDMAAGKNQLEVLSAGSCIKIQAKKAGADYQLSGFSGSFYQKVLSTATEISSVQDVQTVNGDADTIAAYAIGRQPVGEEITRIQAGTNDTLRLYFTHNGTRDELLMRLTPGEYSGDALVDMLQKKLDTQLEALGYEAGTIQAAVGEKRALENQNKSKTGSVLLFILNPGKSTLPDGTYIIDGISGNAAYSIFYHADGRLVPAYVRGERRISTGVLLDETHTRLTFEADGVPYSFLLPAKSYTSEELIRELNRLAEKFQAPVQAAMEASGELKLVFTRLGNHSITNIGGSAKSVLFFQEEQQKGTRPVAPVPVQTGPGAADRIYLEQPYLTSSGLGLFQLDIDSQKSARHVLAKITKALEKTLKVRRMFENVQHELEQAMERYNNSLKPAQDVREEVSDEEVDQMVELLKSNLLDQISTGMVSQSGISPEMVLKLLKS